MDVMFPKGCYAKQAPTESAPAHTMRMVSIVLNHGNMHLLLGCRYIKVQICTLTLCLQCTDVPILCITQGSDMRKW